MKIDYIRLINFKQYYKEQSANISVEKDLNVTVFHGLNGAGKTSLFIAINWCLYKAGASNVGELLNKQAVAEASNNEIIPLVVTVCFKHKLENFIAERVIKFKKVDNKVIIDSEDFTLSRIGIDGNAKILPNPIGVMNSILPENVREYFFFDGEKMEDLTRPDNKKIEDAIKNIMRLPIIDKTYDHLNKIADEFRRDLKKQGSVELEKLIDQEEIIEKSKEAKEQEKGRLAQEIRQGKQQIKDLETALRENEKSKRLQEKRDDTKQEIDRLENFKIDILEQIKNNAMKVYCQYLDNVSKKTLAIYQEKRKKGEIPSGIKEQFIRDLIEKDRCICGRNISNDKDCLKHLEEYLSKSTSSEIENLVLSIPGEVKLLSSIAGEAMLNLKSNCKIKNDIDENLETCSRELDDIKKQLGNAPDVDVSKIEDSLSSFQKHQDLNINTYGKLEKEIENMNDQIKMIIKQREEEEKKQKVLKLLSKKEELCRKSAEAVLRIKEKFYEQTRLRIESETKKVFSSLAWKQEHFNDIKLDPDFHLEVIDRWDKPSREEISAGERQILSLSFLASMVSLSGEEAPVIMDTPFGRLSGNHLETVANNLPKLVSQLILLVTDREWQGASTTKIIDSIGYQYNLDFNQKNGCTVIREVDNDK